ncbi:hypothetical protein H2198_001754 [Neophaeococcomyces mojaviensis]|uniref:Uncharacterized protein n=1 Tax=Neophaeococcomyces mojaviensis TaxID=3383035 RepID=A0ACC3AGR2_9EURO|nr:hypothetical protein H2198_001754 [Knufia sp. JES_112]
MPRSKKTQSHRPILDDYPDPADLDPAFRDDEAAPTRTSRKKSRNAYSSAPRTDSSSPDSQNDEPVAPDDPPSPPRQPSSLLNQIVFPASGKSRPLDIREELSTEKVSDQYTPPSDGGLNDHIYGKSPNADSVAVSSPANTPPVEPGFLKRNSFQSRALPTSPALRNARPLSFGGSIPPPPSSHGRYQPSAYGSPPAPHLPQPHFYAAQDIDLGIPKPGRSRSAEEPLFTRFVRLPTSNRAHSHGIVLGYEGRINLCAYDGEVMEEIGVITGMPGKAVDAELLTWTSGPDPFASMRPLLAVTLMQVDQLDMGRVAQKTSLHVYSLSQQKHVLDLLQVLAELPQPLMPGFAPSNTEPSHHLRLKANGNYLIVSSGRSGEVFAFCPTVDETSPTFECLGKFWTCIQPQMQRRDSSHHRPDISRPGSRAVRKEENVPVVASSGRWLAVSPPSSSSMSTIDAVLGSTVRFSRSAGLEARSAGSRPSINCDVDSPDVDTLLAKVARGVAQEMVKGARWLGDQGMQAWQSYWKKEDSAGTPPLQQQYSNMPYASPAAYGQFPPTHATSVQSKEPELVSIYDLKSLHDPHARKIGTIVPVATFQPPNGCSFLSFAPHGLMLLTASRKGDYQYVWDLLEMKHRRNLSCATDDEAVRSSPQVRQVARFDRLSGSVIVDVVWEIPTMTRFALLTKNKTVHLFDLPASAVRWPPPRMAKKSRPISAPPNGEPVSPPEAMPVGGFFASAMSIAGKTQPMLSNWRGRAPSTGGGIAGIGTAGFGIAAATGARGSKAVASGLSKSLGAATETVSRLQHAGESRLSLKTNYDVVADRICWTRRASKPGICILGDDELKYYQVRMSRSRDQKQYRLSTVFDARRAVTAKVPALTALVHAEGEVADCQGFWAYKQDHAGANSTTHPLSFAEIDTNAPFQPFHLDRRVTLSVLEAKSQSVNAPSSTASSKHKSKSMADEQWAFGDEVLSTRLNIHPAPGFDGDTHGSVIYRETSIANDADGRGELILSTTKRKKAKRATKHLDDEGTAQEGFFEDDCDVLDSASDHV